MSCILENEGDSIEGLAISIKSRKFDKKSRPFKFDDIGMVMHFKCRNRSEGEITKELDPKRARYDQNSNLDLGDKIKAEVIEVYTQCKKIKIGKISNYSSTHGIQALELKDYTCAIILMPWRYVMQQIAS